MANQPEFRDEVNYGAVEFDQDQQALDEGFEPVIISVWDLLYPLGMKMYIYVNFFIDTLICITTLILMIVLSSKSNTKEKVWVGINNSLLMFISVLKLLSALRSNPNRRLAVITLYKRILLFIPQMLFIIWSFLSVYFYIRNSRDPIHIWILLLLIYSYSLSFVIIIDCILVMFFVFFLLRIYANPLVPLPESVNGILYRTKYSEELTTKDDLCTICLNKYIEDSTLIYLPCHGYHHFHEDCILQWLRTSSVCPICKQVITEQLIQANPITIEVLRNHFAVAKQGD